MARQRTRRSRSADHLASNPSKHLRFLESQRSRLEAGIRRLKREIDQREQQYGSFIAQVQAEAEPFIARARALDDEIHAMFAEILATRKLGKRSRKQIQDLWANLQSAGLLSRRRDEAGAAPGEAGDQAGAAANGPDVSHAGGPGPDGGHSAAPGDGDDCPDASWATLDRGVRERSRGLRDRFLQLAGRFHPDLAGDADTRERHTEVMKELNRAYREGDAAGLFALGRDLERRESARAADQPPAPADARARCAAVEAEIAQLEAQHGALTDALSALRGSELAQLIDLGLELSRAAGEDPLAGIVDELREGIAATEAIRDFVRAFRDREMTIAEFLRGPTVASDDEDADTLEHLLDELLQVAAAMTERRRPRRRSGTGRRGDRSTRRKRRA